MRDVIYGASLLLRGMGIVLERKRLFLLGMVPPLITSVLMIIALVALGLNLDTIVGALTGFTQDWGTIGAVVRAVIGVVLFLAALLVMVLAFTTITLLLGDPIYQEVSKRVDIEMGGLPPETEESTVRTVGRSIRQSVVTIVLTVLAAIVCFLLGLVPVIGAVLAAVASALTGGRLMARELTSPGFERRGFLETSQRKPVLQQNRALSMGFAVPAFWLLAIPGVAVLVFPAAVAGATLVVRRMLDEPTSTTSA